MNAISPVHQRHQDESDVSMLHQSHSIIQPLFNLEISSLRTQLKERDFEIQRLNSELEEASRAAKAYKEQMLGTEGICG